jgi:quercetin dioxygenase-like cupin family protein
MKSETITERADLMIRRHILEPGETLPWHTDLCHRFTVVVSGEALSIEYRHSGEVETFPVHPGMAGWNEPQPKVHRGINAGTVPYEEVIIFFLDESGMEPQPEAES